MINKGGGASFTAVPQAAGLVAAYGFNEASGTTITDASSNNNSGTAGAGVTRTASGRFGGALTFGGSGMVTIPNAASLSLTTGMTLEAWVNPTAVNSDWRDVVYKGNDIYYLMATSTKGPRPAAGATLASAQKEAFGTATLAANTWTHLAVTYDGAAIRVYVNGAQVSSVAATGAIKSSTNALQIGGDAIYGQFFQGAIDEVRIYNRALSVAEVQSDMTTPVDGTVTPPPPPPVDATAPTMSITSPSSTGTYTTTASSLTMSGSASDNVGVTQVTWSNDRGGSGTATGTTNWSVASIALQMGANVLTVTARDAANNVATTTLTATLTAPSPGVAGLVAAYGFNEASGTTASDASGNNNAGTLGASVTRTTTGRFGGGLAFNGGMVTIPNSPSLGLTTAMTLEAWVNPTTVISDWVDVVYKGNDNYFLMATSTNGPRPVAGVTFAGTSSTSKALAPATLAANTWTHLATTYDGTTLRLYVNGAQVATLAAAQSITVSSNPLQIGGDAFYGQFFRGAIDEVRVYNRALSATEVQSDMNTPVGGTATPPPPSDTTVPTVSIVSPGASGTYTTTTSSMTMSGTASDNVGVAQVTWSNSRGGSGTATGTTSWSANAIALQSGTNVVTVTARDAASNAATATITVTYNAPAPPVATAVAIQVQPSASATSGVAFGQQPALQLRDASNASVGQSGVVVTAAIATGGGTLGGTATATTNASGVATFTNLSITGTAGGRTLSFSAPALTGATSSTITVSAAAPPPPPPPPGTTEPVFNPSVNTMVYQDNMDQYASATAMGAAGQTGPRITPNPSPMTTSSSVNTSQNQMITGRSGSGKALRLGFSGGNQTSATFITWNMPSTPTLATHTFQYWARVNFASPFSGTVAVKWFEAWHVKLDRVQWNTHDHLPCPTSTGHGSYWQVYDQSRETTCQGNQPVGPYMADISDNQWHRFTYQYRPNSSAGSRDGLARMWVDGVKIIDISAATIGVTPPGGDKPWCLADDVDTLAVNDGMFNQFWGSTQTTDTPSWTYDIDDYFWWIQ